MSTGSEPLQTIVCLKLKVYGLESFEYKLIFPSYLFGKYWIFIIRNKDSNLFPILVTQMFCDIRVYIHLLKQKVRPLPVY